MSSRWTAGLGVVLVLAGIRLGVQWDIGVLRLSVLCLVRCSVTVVAQRCDSLLIGSWSLMAKCLCVVWLVQFAVRR